MRGRSTREPAVSSGAIAVDAAGRLTAGATYPVNRGFAMLGDQLFMGTLDAHLVALDMKTGAVVWDVGARGLQEGLRRDAGAAGRQGQGHRRRRRRRVSARAASFDAYDAQTGGALWRFYTIPGPGEPGSETWPSADVVRARGGGAAWVTGTYDPELNLVYCGTGNPNPDYYGDDRKGDNLYTCSLRRARCGHRPAEVALPVHAARHARLGLEPRAGACATWRSAVNRARS